MNRMRYLGCCVGLLACLVAIGCGGGSGTTGSSSTSEPASKKGQGFKSAGEVEPGSRGIKGENTATEAETKLHISATDCEALRKLAEKRLGIRLTATPSPRPPLSQCRLEGPGTSITVYLDTGFAAHQRYRNRIEEAIQFNTTFPAGVPHYIPHVGEKAPLNRTASWIPALHSVLAVRGNRWLTVTFTTKGKSTHELRTEAATLARAGFRLSASG